MSEQARPASQPQEDAVGAAISRWWNDGPRKTWREDFEDYQLRNLLFAELRDAILARLTRAQPDDGRGHADNPQGETVPLAPPTRAQPDEPSAVVVLLDQAAGIIEMGDQRLLARDGDAGGSPPDLSLAEWRQLYVTITKAAALAKLDKET